MLGHRFGQLPVSNLRSQDAQYDGHLVERHQPPAHFRWRYLGNIHRRKGTCHTDARATHESGYVEHQEVREGSRRQGRHREEYGGDDEQRFSAILVGHGSCHHGSYQASHQSGGHGHTLHRRVVRNAEEGFIEGFGASDDYPIVAKQQSSHGGHHADEVNKRAVVLLHNTKFEVMRL